MDISLQKSVRNGIWGFVIGTTFSFVYGGIYTEMINEGLGFSIENIFLAFIGAIFAGVILFIPIFVISLIVFYFKTKKSK